MLCLNFSYSIAMNFCLLNIATATISKKKNKVHQPFKWSRLHRFRAYVQNHSFTPSSLLPLVIVHSEVTTWPSRPFSLSLSSLFFFFLISALCLEAINTHLCICLYGNIESSFCWMFLKLTWTDMNQCCHFYETALWQSVLPGSHIWPPLTWR